MQVDRVAPVERSGLEKEYFASREMIQLDREIPGPIRELERSGRVRVDSYDAIFPVALEDGTSAFVPVQQVRVVPVAQCF